MKKLLGNITCIDQIKYLSCNYPKQIIKLTATESAIVQTSGNIWKHKEKVGGRKPVLF